MHGANSIRLRLGTTQAWPAKGVTGEKTRHPAKINIRVGGMVLDVYCLLRVACAGLICLRSNLEAGGVKDLFMQCHVAQAAGHVLAHLEARECKVPAPRKTFLGGGGVVRFKLERSISALMPRWLRSC